ncbi:MAG TPA: ClpXP adapter SpxH family protein [Flavobacteriaceae bacterium]|nr:ClpXP adapter SpxH family protein [Flavobacteriaceae bacterium]
MNENKNPMYCDPETGVCEIPGTTTGETMVNLQADKKPIRLLYFTDPICSSCWGIEPQLRKLKLEYGDIFDMEYRMGGLLSGWENYGGSDVSGPESVAEHWEEASGFYQMPIDGDVWLEDPLDSSYPPSVAFKAAQMQDAEKAVSFMRKVREMLFLEKKNISKWEHLKEAAEASNLDVRQFKTDYEGKARERFEEDLELKKQMGVRGFPTIFFADEEGNRLLVYGSKPYEKYGETLLKLYPEAKKQEIDTSPENLFNLYPTYTTREFAEISGKNMDTAENSLEGLVSEGKIKKQESKNGPLWIKM